MNSWRIAGIRFSIHPLFWLVMIAGALTGQFVELLTLFTLVIIHELGHVFVARAVGWRIRSMELLPFGGVAKVDEWGSTKARDEVIVALAGPLMNAVMIATGYLLGWLGLWEKAWCDFFVRGNAAIACFNLLPVWPLDGGKILQALLSQWLSYYKTIYLSLGWSFLVIAVMLAGAFYLPFRWNVLVIGGYLLVENHLAWKQAHYQFLRFLLAKKSRDVSRPNTAPVVQCRLNANDQIGQAVKLLKKEHYHCFHIFDEKRKRTVKLPEDLLIHAFFEKNPQRAISELLPIG